jgi:aspartyl-tRNA(Asn)/glutamyl-tRNA(Gln) amidotransferase subunit C
MNSDDVKKLANLARIELSQSELEKMPQEIESILGYVKKISESATTSDDSRIESAGTRNVTSEDKLLENNISSPADLIKEAPDSQDSYFKVKKIL